jgi:gluconolactonase
MSIVRLDPAFDALVRPGAQIEKIAGGFTFIEGPIWRPSGVLWFSDVVGNVTRQWSPDGNVIELLRPGGYDDNGLPPGGFIGPNGATAGEHGTVVMCQHGNRRVVRITDTLEVTTIVDNFKGRKFNSPNDVVYRSDGSMYFTDPPYGLPKADDDPSKELPFNGVFKLTGGRLDLIIDDMTRPNGLAFSPDEKTLYVANSDENYRVWMRYDVQPDGTVRNGSVFADVSAEKEPGLPDGMKIDSRGNIWATGPGGVWVFAPDARHLGTLKLPEQPANCAWGDDWTTLYITAETGLYRLKTSITGQKLVYA